MKLSLVIPCYNEADNVSGLKKDLWPVVNRLAHNGEWQEIEVVFVDDGSKDATVQLLEQEFGSFDNVKLVQHGLNRGLGAALRTGFYNTSGDVIVTTDSDATYPFREIEGLLARLKPGVDVVTASPYHPQGGVDNVPGYRIFISKGASTLYRILVNPSLHTYTSMFRAYRRPILEKNRHGHDGFLSVTEILVRSVLNGACVVEHPCRLQVRRYGQSKAKIISITKSHLTFMGQVLSYRIKKLLSKQKAEFLPNFAVTTSMLQTASIEFEKHPQLGSDY